MRKNLNNGILDKFLNGFSTWLYTKKEKLIVLEHTKLKILGLEHENVRIDMRNLQDAEISN
jgi:hypothetical protein